MTKVGDTVLLKCIGIKGDGSEAITPAEEWFFTGKCVDEGGRDQTPEHIQFGVNLIPGEAGQICQFKPTSAGFYEIMAVTHSETDRRLTATYEITVEEANNLDSIKIVRI